MQVEICEDPSLQQMDSTTVISSVHKRLKSDCDKRLRKEKLCSTLKSFHYLKQDVGEDKGEGGIKEDGQLVSTGVPSSLKQEIQQLEKRLQDQFAVRHALEKGLGHKSCSSFSNDSSIPKPTKKLIKEIAILELEVMYLEQHLLSLYRKAFEQQITHLSPAADMNDNKKPMNSLSEKLTESSTLDFSPRKQNLSVQSSRIILPRKSATSFQSDNSGVLCQEKHSLGVNRSHSSLLQRSVCSARLSPSAKNLSRALKACHTLPLSFLEDGRIVDHNQIVSLAEHLGTRIADHIPETPNKLSEDMVRCMAAIYCRLKDSPLVYHGLKSSPSSSFSSVSACSSHYAGDLWSPSYKRGSTLGRQIDNTFQADGLIDFSGPYHTMMEVSAICKESKRFSEVETMLHNYKSLVDKLEAVNPSEMKNEEKLAFWINIHNAMMMHAHLEYGIPQSSTKRILLLTKITYIINGRSVNAEMIQGPILRCCIHPPGQWLRLLLYSRFQSKDRDECQDYAIEHPEPLLHFALCSGSYSDPAVRIYNPKRLYQQLESAKEEHIRANIRIHKEQKILLPKIIESYTKAANLSLQESLNMIERYLPVTLRIAMYKCQEGRSRKLIEWIPHNFTFRYLLPRESAEFL
ncbi:uncharacterized protein [Typha angustifolia]|uniref:uncharacterized protein n=1 Tax=Typha angustifolia TaxID=59011 RepID=UPI003C3036CE